ncbi:hypothetical protein GDO86_009756 [Hymenochirus boettgeri]|uniref:Uncharacterized protein n=1 Tax=Hymenochirus boettgeri TaxID=247094 RepID=A0A8T2JMH9_9PIPI|nr:hypothetical protein GDO86_009756 [Hymenochirus boettgeri]
MCKLITLCLSLTLLAIVLPKQVFSQSTVADNSTTTSKLLASGSSSNASNVSSTTLANNLSSSTLATNISLTTRGHASSVYAAPSLFLAMAVASLFKVCC